MRAAAITVGVCLSMLWSGLAQASTAAMRRTEIRIPPQGLASALKQFEKLEHIHVLYFTADVGNLRTSGASGYLTANETLTRLLSGTGLIYRYVDANAVSIVLATARATSAISKSVHGANAKHAAGSAWAREPTDPPMAPNPARKRRAARAKTPMLKEIVVTGTHIRGAVPQWTPVTIFDSDEISASGYPTLEEFVKSIPQNTSQLGSGTVDLSQDADAGNLGFGTDIDLRGLGFGSTLVLVNGHRLAPAGVFGSFTDVSVIPLAAVQQIQVMTSGASAIYGSDAIGGVVNFILRTNQNGAMTSLEYGSVTQGGQKDFRATQSLGTEWQDGSAFLSYEYHKQTPLLSSDRSFSRGSGVVSDLDPGLHQNSLFGSLRQALGEATLTGDALYTIRSDQLSVTFFGAPTTGPGTQARTTQYQGTLELEWPSWGTWVNTVSASLGGNRTSQLSPPLSEDAADNRMAALDIGSSGPVARTSGGPVRAAFGAQFRREQLSQEFLGPYANPEIHKSARVASAYGEATIPLVSTVLLHLAARYDHYSDFGSSTNPEVGIAWHANTSVKLRGTWGTSYSAPTLSELYSPLLAFLLNSPDPLSASGQSAALVLNGGNPKLGAERARQWTAGVDLTPSMAPGLALHATYYRIHFIDQISFPPFPSLFDVLDAGNAFNPYIQRNPSLSTVEQLAAPPNIFANETIYPGFGPTETLAAVAAVVTDTQQNIATTDTDGVDASVAYQVAHGQYEYHFNVSSTYVLNYRKILTPGTPAVSILNTLYNPLRFRARATVSVERNRVSGDITGNYWGAYDNTEIANQSMPISSWTTLDVSLHYRMPIAVSLTRDLALSVSCVNCLNRNPPAVNDAFDPVQRGYDPSNANPLGRFLSVTVTADW